MERGQEARVKGDEAPPPRPLRRPRCALDGCSKRVACPPLGRCPSCASSFCAAHRLPESHACPDMDALRRSRAAQNAERVRAEACSASKVAGLPE